MEYVNKKILVIDDNDLFRLNLKFQLSSFGSILEADSEEMALKHLESQQFDLIVCDIEMENNNSGIRILSKVPDPNKVIIVSSNESDDIASQAYELGARIFLKKEKVSNIQPLVSKLLSSNDVDKYDNFFINKYVTRTESLKEKIIKLLNIDLKSKNLLITGETGVGKSLIANFIHEQNYNESSPFIHINCAEVPENLIESELFGYKKGAFTGADSDKKGKFQLANGGTLFLDEVGTMSNSMQQKLLKVLDTNQFYPLGSNQLETSNFTLITATCEDLEEQIQKKIFRKDLFYRLSTFKLHLSSLRERAADIPFQISHFIAEATHKIILSPEVQSKLKDYSYPGNTRELRSIISFITAQERGLIKLNDLPNLGEPSLDHSDSEFTNFEKIVLNQGFTRAFSDLELRIVRNSMERNQGKVNKCLQELKISSSKFYRIKNKLA